MRVRARKPYVKLIRLGRVTNFPEREGAWQMVLDMILDTGVIVIIAVAVAVFRWAVMPVLIAYELGKLAAERRHQHDQADSGRRLGLRAG